MNKEITIYELLGLIKDDKAPRKIKFDGYIFVFKNKGYVYEDGNVSLIDDYKDLLLHDIKSSLNFKIEIIEEDKDIEEITIGENTATSYMTEQIRTDINVLADKINELIKEVNRLRKEINNDENNCWKARSGYIEPVK